MKVVIMLNSLPKVVVQVQVSVVVVFSCQLVILLLITQYLVHGNWYSVFGFDTQYLGISSQLNQGCSPSLGEFICSLFSSIGYHVTKI